MVSSLSPQSANIERQCMAHQGVARRRRARACARAHVPYGRWCVSSWARAVTDSDRISSRVVFTLCGGERRTGMRLFPEGGAFGRRTRSCALSVSPRAPHRPLRHGSDTVRRNYGYGSIRYGPYSKSGTMHDRAPYTAVTAHYWRVTHQRARIAKEGA
jgi:hypothetical protein